MTKNNYLNTGLISLLAVILLVIMYYWPHAQYSLNNVILGKIKLSAIDRQNFIKLIGTNYALDSVFIFTWIGLGPVCTCILNQ